MLKVENSGEPVLNQRIDEDLDFFLGRFVAKVRKEDGQKYPGKTIYEMICSLQCYLRFQRKGPLFLIDKKGCKFRNLNSALNFVFGNCFALRAGQEHRNLRMKNSQLSLHESGAEYLQYVEVIFQKRVRVFHRGFQTREN